MQWRFADLPVRIKFLVTLGIPVLGMVLLIGKQVDSNIKRSTVFNYIRDEFQQIGLYADVIMRCSANGPMPWATLPAGPFPKRSCRCSSPARTR